MEDSPEMNKKMIPNKRRFNGNFYFNTFEPSFRRIFPPYSAFKGSMKEACNNQLALIKETRMKIYICSRHWPFEHQRVRKDLLKRQKCEKKFPKNWESTFYPWTAFHTIIRFISNSPPLRKYIEYIQNNPKKKEVIYVVVS